MTQKFKLKALNAAMVFALASSAAHAQDQATDAPAVTEEVVVSGIRYSLQTASDLKRKSQVVVDAITAEDVGKFPDANVADSLQRITGVQISRDRGGEGRFVSIRGLGSQFNMTMLNGRTLATDNAGRDFSFDVMPSEAISGAQIYKTSMASLPEGSIGGLINLTTAKPLDKLGLHASGSVGALYDEGTEDWGEQISGVVSNSFLDDTLGASLGVSYSKRRWRADTYSSLVSSTEVVDSNGDGIREEAVDGRGLFPGIISYQTKFGERERLGFVGAIQYRPNDRIETTVDAFYSNYKSPENSYSYNVNFYSNDGWDRFENATLEPWEAGDETNRWLITSFDLTDIPLEIGNDTSARETDTYMVGWNTIFQATDDLEFTFDIAYSGADRPVNGKDYYTVAGMNAESYSYQLQDPVPTIDCTLEDGRKCWEATNDEIGLHFMEPKGENVKDDALSVRFDGDYELNFRGLDTVLEFGATYSSRVKDKEVWKPDNACGYCTNFEQTLGDVNVNAVVPFPEGGYDPGVNAGFNSWPALDPLALFRAARLHRGDEFFEDSIMPKPLPRASSEIEEIVSGVYLQANFTGNRWDANVGGRWVQTDVTSNGHTQQLLSLEPIPNSTNFTGEFSDVAPISVESSYENFLPSMNFSYDLREDLKLRIAASQTITRPTISQMGPDVNWEINSLPPRVTRNGNPYLEPVEADSADVSLEWYGDQGSSAALAFYYKEITNRITSAQFPEEIIGETFEVSSPINGDSAEVNGVEVAFQHFFDNGFGVQGNYTWADSEATITIDGTEITTEMDGLSKHTYNLVGIYESGPFSGRLAWSYRDEFVACSSCNTITKDFGSLDLSSSYEVSDHLSVYVEAQNLLEDDTHTYFGDPRATAYYEAYARRFEFGLRARY